VSGTAVRATSPVRKLHIAALVSGLLGATLPGCTAGGGSGTADTGRVPALDAVEELRLGDVDDPDLGFSRIGSVDVDRDGQVFVFEMLDRQIRVYDADGRFVRRIGRQGEGPGEFQRVSRFGVAGDTLWTYDFGLRRLTLFDRTGTVLSTAQVRGVPVPMPRPGMTGSITPRGMRADGLLTSDMTSFSFTASAPPGPSAESDTVMVPRVLFDGTGAVVDTVGWFAYPPMPTGGSERVEIKGTRYAVPRATVDQELRTMMDDGGYYIARPRPATAETTEFTVSRIAESGDTLWRKAFRYTPARYTDAYLDSMAWRSARIPGAAYNPDTGPAPTPEGIDIDVVQRTVRDAMHWPEFQLPVEAAIVGDDGTLWLRREDDGGLAYRYMVIDGEGVVRGVIAVPRRLQVRWISADRFWAVDTDELEVPWLVRFRYD